MDVCCISRNVVSEYYSGNSSYHPETLIMEEVMIHSFYERLEHRIDNEGESVDLNVCPWCLHDNQKNCELDELHYCEKCSKPFTTTCETGMYYMNFYSIKMPSQSDLKYIVHMHKQKPLPILMPDVMFCRGWI